jgi:hypothetical protein
VGEPVLVTPDGRKETLADLVGGADWNVLVFISRDCPCVAAHDDRLRELATVFADRGVRFFAIDAEVGASPAIAALEMARRRYPFPVVVDTGAALAERMGAEYATYTVVLGRGGQVLYRGGIDSDKQRLHPEATLFLREALDDLTAGKPPRRADSTALGCALRKW